MRSGNMQAPSTSGYGSIKDGTASGPSFDFETSGYTTTNNNNSSSSRGLRSWWRVGIIVAAAATALTASVAITRFVAYTGTAQQYQQEQQQLPGSADTHAQEMFVAKKPADSSADNKHTPTTGGGGVRQTEFSSASGGTPEKRTFAETTQSARSSASQSLAFVASNEYTRRGDVIGLGYPWLEGNILVEPHRSTSLEVVSPVEGMTYSWEIVETVDPGETIVMLGDFVGDVVDVVFGKAPKYTVVLIETDRSQEGETHFSNRRTEVEVFCKYVRREIRSLFDDERNEMFDAMKVLWDVNTTTGVELYGDNYMDVWSMDMFHQIGASDIDCDHLHDGIGFGITHSMVTMMFENSLQLVNPKLSLPYWDFTIEAYNVDKDFAGDYDRLRDASDLWTEDWFGSVDPVDFQVKNGRWGYTKVPVVPEEHRDLLGADVYGRMRSPWNVLDREYLTRGMGEMCGLSSTDFYTWPTCMSHYEMQDMYTSYYGYTWHSQYGPHGPVHVWIGGNIDCTKDMEVVSEIVPSSNMLDIAGFAFIERKGLFREGLFKCSGFAEIDVSAAEVMESGQCGCLDLDLNEGDDYIEIYELFAGSYDFPEFTEAEKRKLAIQYCSGVIGIGESSQSSSPLDPTFWSLHPTMERLLSFKLMTGTFTDVSWPDEPGTWTGMDGTVYDVVISDEADECYGHRGSDVFPYGILENLMTPQFTLWGVTGPNTFSNRELVHLFDPQQNALSYIYDNFEWPHCAAQGIDFHDFYNPSTGEKGFKGRGNTVEGEKKKVEGFGVFERGSLSSKRAGSARDHFYSSAKNA